MNNKLSSKNMELEKIKDEARKQISKAIGDALIDVRGEQQFLK